MDPATVFAGLRTINEIVKALISTKSDSERQNKTVELKDTINAILSNAIIVQSEQSKIQEENRTLKEEIARMKQWEAEKKRYKLVRVFDGSVVYALRKDMSNGEIAHYICTCCYENGNRSILNPIPDKDENGFVVFFCPSCKAKVSTRFRGGVSPKYAEELT